MMQSNVVTPKIYLACLAAYNAGCLHGCWIDATQEPGIIWQELRDMLASSPEPDAEEWAIHDYEGFGKIHLSEWEGIEQVNKLACFISEHGELGAGLLEHFSGDLREAEKALESYSGCYTSLADYVQEMTEETTEIPGHLVHYIDYEGMTRDMEINGDLCAIETSFQEVHVFWKE